MSLAAAASARCAQIPWTPRVISFHSLEDRIVKNFMRGAARPALPERLPVKGPGAAPPICASSVDRQAPAPRKSRLIPARGARCCALPEETP